MASIKKRGNAWSVIYSYKGSDGSRKQKWERFPTFKEAKKRKAIVEMEMETNQFIAPTEQTIEEFFENFILIYGSENWSASTFEKNKRMIYNYIIPFLGDIKLQDITPLAIEKYYLKLSKTQREKLDGKTIQSGTIIKIHKLLKTAFKAAKLWDLISVDPYEKVRTPHHEYKKREIWDSETILEALRVCNDPRLSLAIHLSFACSMRLGEILGLQWKNVHITEEDIQNDNARIDITCQYGEVSKEAIETINRKEIIFEFPNESGNQTKFIKVLKNLKTSSSKRTVWLPKTLSQILQIWKKEQDNYKEYYGEVYSDYDLVVCLEHGVPCSHNVIRKSLKHLIEENDLPPIVFHSLRHASATYKLRLNKGDIKATQGDTGHAQADMITDLYAHIMDEDRKHNAQRFDESFYAQTGENVEVRQNKVNIDELINTLKDNPELLAKVIAELK